MPNKYQRLRALEAEATRAEQQITNVLRIIRDEKLHEGLGDTFEEYCRDNWSLGEQIGDHRMMPIKMP